ncbi:MAG: sulfotransferase [Tahibacter sp.]
MTTRVEALRRQGLACAAAGQWLPAVDRWEALLALLPGDVQGSIELSKAFSRLGRYRAAREQALSVPYDAPMRTELRLEWALGLRYFGDVDALLQALSGVQGDLSAEQCVQAADMLASVDAHAQAHRFAEAAVAKDPSFAPAFYMRGRVHVFHGRMKEAAEDFETCIGLAPDAAPAHWSLSGLAKVSDAHHHVERLSAAVARAQPGSENEAQLAYALHSELHELGRHDQAWDALQRGCRVMRSRVRFDAPATARTFAAIHALCTKEFIDDAVSAPAGGPEPLFIVGLFRSGTTLLEQILAGHSQVTAGGESQDFASSLNWTLDRRTIVPDEEQVHRAATADFGALATEYRRLSRRHARTTSWWTEKLPSNFLYLGYIAKALPHTRFINLVRDPRDTAFSNLRTLFSHVVGYAYDQAELAAYMRGYEELMAHWRRVLPDRLLNVRYADLVRDPETEVRRIAQFLGLEFEPSMLKIERGGGAVNTASSVKVRQGILGPRAPDWLPYEQYLQLLFEALEAP